MVMGLLDKAFDVLVLRLGVIKRVYVDVRRYDTIRCDALCYATLNGLILSYSLAACCAFCLFD